MNIVKPILIATSLLLSQASFASDDKHEEGEKLYKTHCAACHGSLGGMDMTKRIAPPIAAVKMHYIDTYADEASFVEAVSNWIEKQDESKSLMRGAIQKFKIMPPITVPKEEAKKIAAYIFSGDLEELEGFKEHVEEEHGKEGMGKGKHDGHGKGKGKGHGKGMHHGEGKGQGHGKGEKQAMTGQAKGMGKMQGMHGKGMEGMHEMMKAQGMDHQQGMKKMQKAMQKRMHKMGKHGGKRTGMGAKMMQKLNLSAEQQQKMQTLIQEKESRIGPLKREMHEINKTLGKLDTTSPDYKAQIFSLADERAKRAHRMVIEKGEMRMKIEAILSAEQRTQLSQLRQKRQQRKASKHGH
ncbi:MAG: Spy/CpxP family protein refolding chaperone [Cocleimonas sp.]